MGRYTGKGTITLYREDHCLAKVCKASQTENFILSPGKHTSNSFTQKCITKEAPIYFSNIYQPRSWEIMYLVLSVCHYQSKVFVCVSNNRTDMVDRLLILHRTAVYTYTGHICFVCVCVCVCPFARYIIVLSRRSIEYCPLLKRVSKKCVCCFQKGDVVILSYIIEVFLGFIGLKKS